MNRRSGFCVGAIVACVALSGCEKKTESTASGAGAASTTTAAAPPAGGGAITKASITFAPTGKWQKSDDGKNEVELWSITNHAAKKSFFAHAVIYYYDKDKKQLGRDDVDLAPMNIEPGATVERVMGVYRTKEPKDTMYREAVMTKANFADNVSFSDATAAPSTRPMGG